MGFESSLYKHQVSTSQPSVPCDQPHPATSGLCRDRDDLIGLACGLSAVLMLRMPLALMSWIIQSVARLMDQVGCHPSELPRRLHPWSSPLALERLDERSWLVVRMGRRGLRLPGGYGGVTLDELGHHATSSIPNPWAQEPRRIAASPAFVTNLHPEDCALY